MAPRMTPAPVARCAFLLLVGVVYPLAAQQGGSTTPPTKPPTTPQAAAPRFTGVPLPGSEAEERLRLDQRLPGLPGGAGTAPTSASTSAPTSAPTAAHWMLRAPSQLLRDLDPPATGAAAPRMTLQLLAPEIRSVRNSALPHSLGDGPLWAGRGSSALVTAGLRLRAGPVRLQLAPQLATAANTRFQVIPYPQGITPARSVWANPFLRAPHAIDLPYRFGDRPMELVRPGESALSVDLPGATFTAGTERLTWGPGVHNQLLLGGNAEGFPHATLTTRRGIGTPVGRVQTQWLLGQLQESPFFDATAANNWRSISGALLQLTPRADSSLTLGIARLVMAAQDGGAPSPAAAFHVLAPAGRPGAPGTTREQVTALFARWLLPVDGAEAYAEWARFAEPASLRDFLEYPGASQGYTVGVQWARPLRGGALQLGGELTQVEQDASARMRDGIISYTGRAIPQGWTHRGKVLGAAIGPGASSQWLSADWFGSLLRVGAYAARIRWNNDVLWTSAVPQVKLEDITLLGGVRASVTSGRSRLLVDYTRGARLGYLYQAKLVDPARGTHAGVDYLNHTLSVTLSTAVGR